MPKQIERQRENDRYLNSCQEALETKEEQEMCRKLISATMGNKSSWDSFWYWSTFSTLFPSTINSLIPLVPQFNVVWVLWSVLSKKWQKQHCFRRNEVGGGEEMGWKCFQDVENQILLPSVSALLALIVASPSVSCQPKGKSLDTAKQQEAKLRMLQEKSPKLTQKTDSVKKSLQLHTTKNLLRKLILQKLSDLKSHWGKEPLVCAI